MCFSTAHICLLIRYTSFSPMSSTNSHSCHLLFRRFLFQVPFIFFNYLAHYSFSRRSGCQPALHARFHADRVINILIKNRTFFPIFLKRQIIKCFILCNAPKHKTSGNPMCITERHAMIYQIIRNVCRICKTIFCRSLHHSFVEYDRIHHAV